MTRSLSRLLVLAAVTLFAALLAAGCGGNDEAGGDTTETTASSALKVGLVADAGQLNDNGFNELAYKGLKRAERELGVTGRVVEAKSAAGVSALRGAGVIIGIRARAATTTTASKVSGADRPARRLGALFLSTVSPIQGFPSDYRVR